MDPETGVVTDNTYRQPISKKMAQKLKEHSERNLAAAARREEERLNRDSLFEKAIGKLINMFAKKKENKAKAVTNHIKQNQH